MAAYRVLEFGRRNWTRTSDPHHVKVKLNYIKQYHKKLWRNLGVKQQLAAQFYHKFSKNSLSNIIA